VLPPAVGEAVGLPGMERVSRAAQRPSDVSCRSLCSHTFSESVVNRLTEAGGVKGAADVCRAKPWFWPRGTHSGYNGRFT
jgi:hypothetical protein